MVAVPRPLLHLVNADVGTDVDIAVESGRIVLAPVVRHQRHTLEELLAQCNFGSPMSPEERDWVDESAAGGELL